MIPSPRTRRVLIVYAHPEPRSLNGSLRDFAAAQLRALGHEVQISDLYAIGFKASVDQHDFPARDHGARLDVCAASEEAFTQGQQTADVAREQAKLLWADAVLFVFPLWWYAMPAILKGWVDRVFAYGFAYGVGEHSDRRWGDRFGEGTLAGKRAMLIVTAGGWESHYGPRGINGPMDELLFPIQHGILYYPGFDVLPPFVVYRTGKVDETAYAALTASLGARLERLFDQAPIAFRRQNGGDYDVPSLELRAAHAPGETGVRVHVRAYAAPEGPPRLPRGAYFRQRDAGCYDLLMRRRRFLVLSSFAGLVAACESRSSTPTPSAGATVAPAAAAQRIVVDVYTDLVCPWCYIGTERLDRAIAASGLEQRIEVRHHAFLLSPETPEEGTEVSAYLRAKTGRDPKEMFGRVEAVARESGLTLDLSKQPRLYATARGHALLRRAPSPRAQRALERALFRAYFVEGVDLTSRAALVGIAVANGFDEASARRIVDDEAQLGAVREEARRASQKGVRGVPHFSFPGGRTLSGAQSEEALRAALAAAAGAPTAEGAEKRGDHDK